jgi:hypothetical protein
MESKKGLLGRKDFVPVKDVNARTRRYVEAGKRKNGIHIKNQTRPDQNRIIDNDDVDDTYLIRELNGRLK